MITTIDEHNTLFSTQEWKDDLAAFNLLDKIIESPVYLKSNGKTFVIGQNNIHYPVWVWTSNTISADEKKQLVNFFYKEFHTTKELLKFCAKPEIAELIKSTFVQNGFEEISTMDLQSFENLNITPAKNQTVKIEQPTKNDLQEIAFCTQQFIKDCFNDETTIESVIPRAEKALGNPLFFVIKDNESVVAMAQGTRESKTHIAINEVYTKKEYREKGLASRIVEHISRVIQDKGKIPLLYTDTKNPASNKAYKNVGFEERGRIVEYGVKKT